jgi:NAD(P)-dependent dehydrogenase (short-subunit alcohol dehydrogenase family)
MPGRLAKQTAIVVGASSGIGRAAAVALARAGAHVVAAARRGDRLDELERQLRAEGASIETCVADSTNPDDVDRMVAQALRSSGRIDLLVYATGTNLPGRALSVLTNENWQRLLETNGTITTRNLSTSQVKRTMLLTNAVSAGC